MNSLRYKNKIWVFKPNTPTTDRHSLIRRARRRPMVITTIGVSIILKVLVAGLVIRDLVATEVGVWTIAVLAALGVHLHRRLITLRTAIEANAFAYPVSDTHALRVEELDIQAGQNPRSMRAAQTYASMVWMLGYPNHYPNVTAQRVQNRYAVVSAVLKAAHTST